MELGRGENDKNALYEMPIELTKIINIIPLKKNPGFSVCSLPVTEGEGLRPMCPSLRLHTGLV